MSIVIFQEGIIYSDKTAVFSDLNQKDTQWIKQGKKLHHFGDFVIGSLGTEINLDNHPFVEEIRQELIKIEEFPTVGFKLPWPTNELKDCRFTIMTRKKFYVIEPEEGHGASDAMVMLPMTDFTIPYIYTSEMPIAMAMFTWGHTPTEIIEYVATVSPDIAGFGIERIEQSSLEVLKSKVAKRPSRRKPAQHS